MTGPTEPAATSGGVGHDDRERLAHLVLAGKKIEALALYRRSTGEDLTAAKRFLEDLEHQLRAGHPERFTSESKAAAQPWVGLGGTHNTIAVVHDARRIVCRLAHGTYLLVLGATAGFGPVALAMLWLTVEGRGFLRGAPRPLVALIVLMFLGSTLALVHQLIRYRWLEIDRTRGELRFHDRRWGPPAFVVRRDDVEALDVTALPYSSGGHVRSTNHVLSVVLRDGGRRGLCQSTDQALVAELSRELRSLAGVPDVRG